MELTLGDQKSVNIEDYRLKTQKLSRKLKQDCSWVSPFFAKLNENKLPKIIKKKLKDKLEDKI